MKPDLNMTHKIASFFDEKEEVDKPVDNTSIEEAFSSGYEYYFSGLLPDKPFEEGTELVEAWYRGYSLAAREDGWY